MEKKIMWWNFKKGKPKGELRIERIQVAWYDMEHNGDCFDESIIKNGGDEKDILNKLGLWTTYVDMDEDTDKNKANRSRVFVYMDNGDCYELQVRKLTKKTTERMYQLLRRQVNIMSNLDLVLLKEKKEWEQ